MKQSFYLIIAIALLTGFTVTFDACKKENNATTPIKYGQITDTRDGKVYKTVQIGTQTWFYLGADIFDGKGYFGQWWTATDQTTPESYARGLHYYQTYITRFRADKNQGYSVRCVKD